MVLTEGKLELERRPLYFIRKRWRRLEGALKVCFYTFAHVFICLSLGKSSVTGSAINFILLHLISLMERQIALFLNNRNNRPLQNRH